MQSVINKSFTPSRRSEDLRQIYKHKLERLSTLQKKQKSKKIETLFKKMPFFDDLHRHSRESGNPDKLSLSPKPSWIAVYKALKNEPDLSFLESSCLKDRICYPVIKGNRLEFYSNPKQKWSKNRFQIKEPVDGTRIPLEEIFVFCVPGLCFDRKGGRLGKGLGYYDKTLSVIQKKEGFLNSSPWFVGLAFKEQIYNETLALKEHDISMDLLLTDSFILAPLNTKRKGD